MKISVITFSFEICDARYFSDRALSSFIASCEYDLSAHQRF